MPASRKYKKTYNTIYLNIMRGGERKGKESGSTKSVNREKLFKEKFSPYHSLALALALALALSLHFHFTYNLSSRFYGFMVLLFKKKLFNFACVCWLWSSLHCAFVSSCSAR